MLDDSGEEEPFRGRGTGFRSLERDLRDPLGWQPSPPESSRPGDVFGCQQKCQNPKKSPERGGSGRAAPPPEGVLATLFMLQNRVPLSQKAQDGSIRIRIRIAFKYCSSGSLLEVVLIEALN